MKIHIANTIADLREQVGERRRRGKKIAFVPTMGNLHAGHLVLTDVAQRSGAAVVVSIFVNPSQFVPGEDFARYPRTLDADLAKLETSAVELAFVPTVEEMYPGGWQDGTRIEVPTLSTMLCGAFRPGHFSGVATVVTKLFNIVQPDCAYFGEKDLQQLRVIQRMVRDLSLPIDVVGVPTVRDSDGLALSSRNGYLSTRQRAQAPALHRVLQSMRSQIRAGRVADFRVLEREAMSQLVEHEFAPQYVAVRRAEDLTEAVDSRDQVVILAAAFLGETRLIDNVIV